MTKDKILEKDRPSQNLTASTKLVEKCIVLIFRLFTSENKTFKKKY